MKILKTYNDAFSAHLDAAKLKDEGIEFLLQDEKTISINPLYSNALGGIKLWVNEGDFKRSCEILKLHES